WFPPAPGDARDRSFLSAGGRRPPPGSPLSTPRAAHMVTWLPGRVNQGEVVLEETEASTSAWTCSILAPSVCRRRRRAHRGRTRRNDSAATYPGASTPERPSPLKQSPPVGPGSDCWLHSNEKVVPVGAWTCVEWEFDGPNNAMHFWLGGIEYT